MTMRWLAIALCTLLSACGSSPKTQFYTLDPVPPQAPIEVSAAIPVQVAAVHILPALDRQEMVRESAPHQFDVSDQNRWAARSITWSSVSSPRISRSACRRAMWRRRRTPPRHDAIVVDILQFDEDGSGAVVFDGNWSLADASSDKPSLSRHVRLSEHAGTQNYFDQAGTMSRVLGEELADNMAGGVAIAGSEGPARDHAAR